MGSTILIGGELINLQFFKKNIGVKHYLNLKNSTYPFFTYRISEPIFLITESNVNFDYIESRFDYWSKNC